MDNEHALVAAFCSLCTCARHGSGLEFLPLQTLNKRAARLFNDVPRRFTEVLEMLMIYFKTLKAIHKSDTAIDCYTQETDYMPLVRDSTAQLSFQGQKGACLGNL